MGGLCCCFSSDNFEDYVAYPNGSIYQICPCARRCMRWFMSTQYTSTFNEVEHDEIISPRQGVSISTTAGLGGGNNLDPSIPEAFQAPPQPLPYNFDSQYARVVRDGLVSRRDKSGMSHLNVGEGEPLRHTNTSHDESAGIGTALQRRTLNCGGFDHDDQVFKPGSPEERSSKAFPRVESTLSILDDEDICATCLDGYNEENPRITTACGHHFHLACIYEWMERSKHCPLCDKEMIFSESL